MTKILIPENAGDLKVISDMVDQQDACMEDPKKKNTSMEAVVVFPNLDKTAGWAKWCVVDNRDHQAFSEDFATLDGAMIYATDLKTTCERQDEWDVEGNFAVMLKPYLEGEKLECDAAREEPLAYWNVDGPFGGDHEVGQQKFVDSIVQNLNKHHTVRYLTEEHDNGDGTYETEHLVEITFLNAAKSMCEVDHALESLNGRDWRMICDKFLWRRLSEVGAKPESFDWPVPDARVTLDYYEDEDDVVKTVTLVWAVDERTWRWCNPASTELAKSEETRDGEHPVTEMCPHCEREVTMEWNVEADGYKAYCPHCGKELMLCDECLHAEDNPGMECPKECKRKCKKGKKKNAK